MRARVRIAAALLGLCLAALSTAGARGRLRDEVRARYTKHEYRIPMRDGVELFTSVYVPKDAGARHRYPILLTRTPYGVAPYGRDETS
jgi:predicted acyl esterase